MTSPLSPFHIVGNPENEIPVEQPLPTFENMPVEMATAKVTSVAQLETGDRVWVLDEVVTMVIEGRVTSIEHKIGEKSGKLSRVHTVKAIDACVVDASLDAIRQGGL